jgi:hypothetical protein
VDALRAPSIPSPPFERHRLAKLGCWVVAYLALSGAIQFFVTSVPYDADTAYHVAVGRLIRAHGVLHAFPWTPFSWLADHYADKELLFHLALAAFARLDWVTDAKIVGTAAGASALTALYLVLRAERVHLAGVWALLPLAACEVFVFRFALVRPHTLSIALAVVGLWAAARGRLVVLALAAALYPFAYVAWGLPLVLVVMAECARLLVLRRVEWRPAAAALAGMAIGVALHPNATNLVRLSWIVVREVLVRNAWGSRQGFELGTEFNPFTSGDWVRLLLPCVVMTLVAVLLAARRPRRDPVALAFALSALAFGVLTVRTARFAEYFAPFSAAALALAAREIAWRPFTGVVFAASLAFTAPSKLETVRVLGARRELIRPELAASLRAIVPEGAQVFTCEWGHTGTMMLALPERRFIVALDPTLFYLKDPDLYRLWFTLPRAPPPHPAETIRRQFGADFVICRWDPRFREFLTDLAFEQDVRTVVNDENWNVYDLRAR